MHLRVTDHPPFLKAELAGNGYRASVIGMQPILMLQRLVTHPDIDTDGKWFVSRLIRAYNAGAICDSNLFRGLTIERNKR